MSSRRLRLADKAHFKWEVGGRTGLDDPKLAEVFFLGAPLPLAGSLYAVCQQQDQIKLVVLDSETGQLQWSQQLVGVAKSVNVSEDRFRRLAGATPSFSDGVLVCATGAGALVAVDLSTKALIWGYQFMTPGSKDVSQISPRQNSAQTVLDGLWRESTIMISEGCVLHTPVDSQNLVCVDLHTGFPKWKDNEEMIGQVPRFDSLYLACVESGNAILVGRKSVRAIGLSDGQQTWERNTESFGRPSGRGYTNKGDYYLPMTSERLLQIELSTGTITKTVETNGVLGNLICYRGDVISHSADRLASFPQDEPNRHLLDSIAGQGPLSPRLLAIKSQLQFQSGDLHSAANSIAAAFEQSRNPAFASALANLIIELVETDYDFGIGLANRYDEALFADRQFEFAAAKIEGMIAKGSFPLAFEELMKLVLPARKILREQPQFVETTAQRHDVRLTGDGQTPVANAGADPSQIKIRLDRWIRSRLSFVNSQVDSPTRARFQEQVGSYLTRADFGDPAERYETLQFFPESMIPEPIQLELARDLLERQ